MTPHLVQQIIGSPAQFAPPMFEPGGYYYYYYYEGSAPWCGATPLDGEWEPFIPVPKETVLCCENVEARSSLLGTRGFLHITYHVTLKLLHPLVADRVVRVGFQYAGPDSTSDFTKISEPLVVLALSGAGLAP